MNWLQKIGFDLKLSVFESQIANLDEIWCGITSPRPLHTIRLEKFYFQWEPTGAYYGPLLISQPIPARLAYLDYFEHFFYMLEEWFKENKFNRLSGFVWRHTKEEITFSPTFGTLNMSVYKTKPSFRSIEHPFEVSSI